MWSCPALQGAQHAGLGDAHAVGSWAEHPRGCRDTDVPRKAAQVEFWARAMGLGDPHFAPPQYVHRKSEVISPSTHENINGDLLKATVDLDF